MITFILIFFILFLLVKDTNEDIFTIILKSFVYTVLILLIISITLLFGVISIFL